MATGQQVADTTLAKGDAAAAISDAEAYRADRIGTAQSDAAHMTSMFSGMESLSPGKKGPSRGTRQNPDEIPPTCRMCSPP